MKKLFTSADRYLQASDWKDMALLKFCLSAMGILIGVSLPAKKKRLAAILAAAVFAATFVPLMAKFLPFLSCRNQDD